ncbi:MAG: hypothetical protein ACREEM_48240 [Blastocatellia bacterium]
MNHVIHGARKLLKPLAEERRGISSKANPAKQVMAESVIAGDCDEKTFPAPQRAQENGLSDQPHRFKPYYGCSVERGEFTEVQFALGVTRRIIRLIFN